MARICADQHSRRGLRERHDTGTNRNCPDELEFGNVPVGTSQSQTATLTNSGGNSATISQAAASGSGFSLTGLSVPLTLAPGQSAAFQVTFAPTSAGR